MMKRLKNVEIQKAIRVVKKEETKTLIPLSQS